MGYLNGVPFVGVPSSNAVQRFSEPDLDLTPGSQNDAIKVSVRKIGGSSDVLCGDEEFRRSDGGNTDNDTRRCAVDGHDRTCLG